MRQRYLTRTGVAVLIALLILFLLFCYVSSRADNVEARVKTHYDTTGRAVNQSSDAKGLHYVTGTVKLSSGQVAVSLNTSISQGRQDVSFISQNTYSGTAFSLDTANTNSYRVIPVSGVKFIIKSSSGSDTATVQFRLEGE